MYKYEKQNRSINENMIKELNNTGYEEILKEKRTAVIEFYSQTCPHCKRTESGLRELVQQLDKAQTDTVVFAKCNIESEPALVKRLEIQALPTLLFIQEGQIRNRKAGFTHKLILQEEIRKLAGPNH